MLKTKMINRETPEKLYVQLYKILRGKIESGEWAVGTLMPTEKKICKTYEVSAATVKTAISHLARQGFLVRLQGKGTFVTDCKQSMERDLKKETKLLEGILNDVNNPLAIIGEKTGWLEDLMEEEKEGDVKHIKEYRDIIKKIKIQINRIREVNNRIIDLPQKIEEIKILRDKGGKK